MEVAVTTGARRRAKLQSNRLPPINPKTSSFLQARCPSCRSTNSVKALKGNIFQKRKSNKILLMAVQSRVPQSRDSEQFFPVQRLQNWKKLSKFIHNFLRCAVYTWQSNKRLVSWTEHPDHAQNALKTSHLIPRPKRYLSASKMHLKCKTTAKRTDTTNMDQCDSPLYLGPWRSQSSTHVESTAVRRSSLCGTLFRPGQSALWRFDSWSFLTQYCAPRQHCVMHNSNDHQYQIWNYITF